MKKFIQQIIPESLVYRPAGKGSEDSGNEIEIGQICNIENMVQVDHTR